MRFTDGVWQARSGVRLHQAVEAREWRVQPKSLTLVASTQHLIPRATIDDVPQLTVRISSPLPDVIRVQFTHFSGQRHRGPSFRIADDDATVETSETAETLGLRSGKLEAVVGKQPWRISFRYDGRLLTESEPGNEAYIVTGDGGAFVREQLELGVGECVYGLGEHFTSFVKNGQSVETWNRDGGTGSDQAYKSVPMYVTNRGYGVLVNHPENVSFEVATERVAKVQFSVPGESLDYFVIGGSGLKEVLANYTALTGRPALPPAWSFGLWLSTSFTTDYDEATVSHFVDGMRERDIPLSVFHFDPFWMKAFQWCDLAWDRQAFPDPEGMIRRLKERGLHVCLWINPYIAQQSPLFDEGMEHGYLLKTSSGDVWQTDLWQPGMGIVDFTNPSACTWYADKLSRLVEMGVDCFKTDFGERIPTDVVYHDGSDPVKMHNYYTFLYNQLVFSVLERAHGPGGAVIFGRSATVGSQRFPTQWGGDNTSRYGSMAETLRGGLSFGLSGFGFWSHDIGGFDGTATPDLYKRWTAFGLTSSHSRLHGMHSYRVPWLFDEECVDVLRHFAKLKCRLMPYLYAAAVEASQCGLPVLRAMILEFEHDPACDYLDRQYMLGGSLLVAPVFAPDGTVSFYLPNGDWTNIFTGERVQGDSWRHEQHGYRSLPLYARPGSIVALGNVDDSPDYDFASGVEMHLFALGEGAEAVSTVYSPAGARELHVTCMRAGDRITVEATGAGKPWTLILHGAPPVVAVQGAEHEPHAGEVRILPHVGASRIEVEVAAQ